ncbi:U11/U12 small nuclear ribonucleoprotein 59 kDa protein [Aristolochia californica]|uniref:U11/U12 small nuclear ribonucleoprotein 59 kDa protein n=1 Tax=Aristolochia californica TaxID=171875 RepID=UPI0035DE1C19
MIQSQVPSSATISLPPIMSAVPSLETSLWQREHLHDHLRDLQDTVNLLKSMHKEVSMLLFIKDSDGTREEVENKHVPNLMENKASSIATASVIKDDPRGQTDGWATAQRFSEIIQMKKVDLTVQESHSLEVVNSLLTNLQCQLAPFNFISGKTTSWEENSASVKLANKLLKSKRNKRWKRKKRKHAAEMLHKERQMYDQADKDADEWRAREIAKDIARRKVEKMKTIAKAKAKEDRQKLESELELILIVEKLQELRSFRIQKLKKQGHFLPEEDDKFLERVRAAVEEEERIAAAAADTHAAKDAIATAEESRKAIQSSEPEMKSGTSCRISNLGHLAGVENRSADTDAESELGGLEGQDRSASFDSMGSLPVEFYHYYHGSNTDMGTLIEVRRQWDAFIRPGGSRIPGHWVQPPPPANEIWASYIVRPT